MVVFLRCPLSGYGRVRHGCGELHGNHLLSLAKVLLGVSNRPYLPDDRYNHLTGVFKLPLDAPRYVVANLGGQVA